MRCQNCGKEVNPNNKVCANCGAPVIQQSQPQQMFSQNFQPKAKTAFQNVSVKPTKKKGMSTGAIVGITLGSVFGAICLLFGILMIVCLTVDNSNNSLKENQEKEWETYYVENVKDAEEISIIELHDNAKKYTDKNILTVAKIDDLDADSFTTDTQHDKILFGGIKFEFKQYSRELQYYSEDDYVIVYGTVSEDFNSWSEVLVSQCHILGSGKKAVEKAEELNSKEYESDSTVPSTSVDMDKRASEENKYYNIYKSNSDIVEVEINELHDNVEKYTGKTVLTVARIDNLNDDYFSTNTQNDKTFFYGVGFYFKQYDNMLSYYKEGEYVIVYGTVNEDKASWVDVALTDCHIVGSGDLATEKIKEMN